MMRTPITVGYVIEEERAILSAKRIESKPPSFITIVSVGNKEIFESPTFDVQKLNLMFLFFPSELPILLIHKRNKKQDLIIDPTYKQ